MVVQYRYHIHPRVIAFKSDRLSAESKFAADGRDVVDSRGYGLASES
jgi:hypothetical protein